MHGQANVSPEAVAAIEGVIRRRMNQFGLKRVTVTVGHDHDGDDVLHVIADYDFVNEKLPRTAAFGLTTEIRDALEIVGETRFPHVHHNFDEHQEVEERTSRRRA